MIYYLKFTTITINKVIICYMEKNPILMLNLKDGRW